MGFNENHRKVVEVIARQIANAINRAIEFDVTNRRDAVTGLPSLAQLERLSVPQLDGHDVLSTSILVVIEVGSLSEINRSFGRAAGDEVLRHVSRRTKAGLRVSDILFRTKGDQFVAVLSETDLMTAESVADAIRSSIQNHPPTIGGSSIPVKTLVHLLKPPKDGRTLGEILLAAPDQVTDVRRTIQSLIH
jgi:two-component system cell cycle response regulator